MNLSDYAVMVSVDAIELFNEVARLNEQIDAMHKAGLGPDWTDKRVAELTQQNADLLRQLATANEQVERDRRVIAAYRGRMFCELIESGDVVDEFGEFDDVIHNNDPDSRGEVTSARISQQLAIARGEGK